MDKQSLLEALCELLRDEADLLARAAGDARSGATDSEVKSESKYDTRAVESSYLARGHAMKYEALAEEVLTLENLKYGDFDPSEPIALGSLVDVKMDRYVSTFFVLPVAGGREIERGEGQDEVTVITPESPIGEALMGKTVGDRFVVPTNKLRAEVRAAR